VLRILVAVGKPGDTQSGYHVKQLDWSRLFLEKEGDQQTPKHIASFPDSNKGTMHHGVYFSHDIVIEQLTGKILKIQCLEE
jgi:hypothetical protein